MTRLQEVEKLLDRNLALIDAADDVLQQLIKGREKL